jgi:rfaE bifunctional protein nucleotidyltransferase chain/domain
MCRFYSRNELLAERKRWKRDGKRVVFTNGCYDVLHPGHVRLLEQARSLGDVLILALNSDESVRRLKGPGRPLFSLAQRARVAGALEAVDAVTAFDEDTPRELIAAVLPDILVKGADWSHFIAGREEVEAAGGEVMTIPLEQGFSTTNIVHEVLERSRKRGTARVERQ